MSASELSQALIDADIWSDDLVSSSGLEIVDAPFVSVGGGLGSLAMVDFLRISGVPSSDIAVLTNLDTPWQTYVYLCNVSQIPPHERLRSDSASTPDNIWGFPAYSVREAYSARSLRGILGPVWNVLTEPLLTDYWTPQLAQIQQTVAREADRIGWWSMLRRGQVRMVRRRHGGGYFTVLTRDVETAGSRRVAFRSSYVHLAVGYPGLRYLDDLQDYREKHGDRRRVVNAYEPHEHVYAELIRRPGTVVLRGAGIVASRILQRLIEDRERSSSETTIWQLFRTYVTGSQGPLGFRRQGGDGWAYQGFNWPKASWGGQLRDKLLSLEGDERREFLRVAGGTTTVKRRLWQRQLKRAVASGYYRTAIGTVNQVTPSTDGKIVTEIDSAGSAIEIPADFVIDATGLEADIREHRLMADLLDHGGARKNVLGRLEVDRNFEVWGTASHPGKLYASGTMTLGGYYAPVDSFLGLQYAALQIVDDLAGAGFCRRLGSARSVAQWWRWVRGREP